MKVLELRLQNLNSLYGEWVIDFRSSPYSTDGIFSVTGPTGAGKTTLLDALCLALYGRTPRIQAITKSSNDIMSRRTGFCYAEATFLTQSGCFTSRWSQHRAKRNPDGMLADAKHEIFETETGTILASQKKKSAEVVEEKTGMDYYRFTRSMLLAQGSFAAFLQASPDERSPILEQITGTEMYTVISKEVHLMKREQDSLMKKLETELNDITFLSSHQEKELRSLLSEAQQKELGLSKEQQNLSVSRLWIERIQELCSELSAIYTDEQMLNEELTISKGKRELLEKSWKAAELEKTYSQLSSIRQLQNQEMKDFETVTHEYKQAETDLEEKDNLLQKAVKAEKEIQIYQRDQMKIISQVRSFISKIEQVQEILAREENDLQDICDELKNIQDKQQSLAKNHQQAEERLSELICFLLHHSEDEDLISECAVIEDQLNQLEMVQSQLETLKTEISDQENDVQHLRSSFDQHKLTSEAIKKQHKDSLRKKEGAERKLQDMLQGKPLSYFRKEKERLLAELYSANRAATFEEERKHLKSQTPCPLCGSLHHPYAEHSNPSADPLQKHLDSITSRIQEAETVEQEVSSLSQEEVLTRNHLYKAEKELSEKSSSLKEADYKLDYLKAEELKRLQEYKNLEGNLQKKVQSYGIFEIPKEKFQALVDQLHSRVKAWRKHWKEFQDVLESIRSVEFLIQSLKTTAEQLGKKKAKKKQSVETSQKKLADLKNQRHDLFGDTDPDVQEKHLANLLEQAQRHTKTVREDREKVQRTAHTLYGKMDSLKKSTKNRQPKLLELEQTCKNEYTSAGFSSEEDFLSSRLSLQERTDLQAKLNKLDQSWADVQWIKKDRSSQLRREEEKQLTPLSLDQLKEREHKISAELKETGELIGAQKQQLADSNAAKQFYKQKKDELIQQKDSCSLWETLHNMIGSSDGKKYRNFAQGLTFELLIAQANKQLCLLSDRYLLIQDTDKTLELNVIDNYQGGEIRPTKNLSGGESFLVSLSLALGLSNMSRNKLRIDSLFLDEGFGSLDEDTLDTALETLGHLHQEGKVIGIISHVQALKERINAQIQVIPVSEGESILKGPGCRRIS